MVNFKLKRRPDLPSGLGDAEMTLAEHIASSAPHPNWSPSGGGSGGGSSGNYAAADHNHDDLYLRLSQVGRSLSGQYLTNIFSVIDHTHNDLYSPRGHNHDSEYVRVEDFSGSGSGYGNSGGSSSSDGLVIPEPHHATYADAANSKPVDRGIVDANKLITNGRYIIDDTQSEQLYNANGSVGSATIVTLSNLNNVTSGVLVTRTTSDYLLTTTALKKIWKIVQVLYSEDSIYIRFGTTEFPSSGFTYTSPTTSYKINGASCYTQKIVTSTATATNIKSTKTVAYNVKNGYGDVEATLDSNGNVNAPSDPSIFASEASSTTYEYEIIGYEFGSWSKYSKNDQSAIQSVDNSDPQSWYVKYENGFMQCGGQSSASGTSTTVTLPVQFANTTYVVLAQVYNNGSTGTYFETRISSKNTDSFTIDHHGDISSVVWTAWGYWK